MKTLGENSPLFTPGQYDTDAVIYALGQAKASRLNEALVYKSQLAQSASSIMRRQRGSVAGRLGDSGQLP